MACKIIKKKNTRVCIGAMVHFITIYNRSIEFPADTTVDYNLDFIETVQVKAFVDTYPRVAQFDDVNMERTASHDFYIRWMPGIPVTVESWISYNGDYYHILHTEHIDARRVFMRLRCTRRGLDTKPGNYA
jgi:hypothetical protein